MEEKKKKLAFVVVRYGLEVNGGAELHCRQLSEKLSSFYDIEIITTKAVSHYTWANEYSNDCEEINGIIVRRFSVDSERNTLESSRLYELIMESDVHHTIEDEEKWIKAQGPYSSSMLKFIAEHRDDYDIFLFMTYLHAPTYFGLPLVKEKAILIPTAHDEPALYFRAFRNLFNIPSGIFYNTVAEKKLVNRVTRNVNIHSNGGYGGTGVEIDKPELPGVFREEQGLDDYIIFVGRIEEGKGCDILFRYFLRYLEETGRDLRLVLAGKPHMAIPEDNRIISLGFVDDEVKARAIYDSRVVVIPSEYESLSMVLLEAMHLSVPVLVNGRCEVLKEHCIQSNGGLYFYNYREFSKMLDYLLDNAKVSEKMGLKGEEYVEDHYKWDDIVNRLSEMIECVSGGNVSSFELGMEDEINIEQIISDIKIKNMLNDIDERYKEEAVERFYDIGLDDFYNEKRKNEIFEKMLRLYRNSEMVPVTDGNILRKIRNGLFSCFGRLFFKKQDKYNRLVLEMINQILQEKMTKEEIR